MENNQQLQTLTGLNKNNTQKLKNIYHFEITTLDD